MNYSLEIEELVAHKHKLEAEIERLRYKLDKIATHPDTPLLLKAYARGDLDGRAVGQS